MGVILKIVLIRILKEAHFTFKKKKILMSLIDDMTAAAVDRSSHSYLQFLECRSKLIEVVDMFMKEDEERILFAKNVYQQIEKIFNFSCTNNHT